MSVDFFSTLSELVFSDGDTSPISFHLQIFRFVTCSKGKKNVRSENIQYGMTFYVGHRRETSQHYTVVEGEVCVSFWSL